ncbi:hypothetical protein FAIPA1_190075 [Frankia sp. AiPs1]
MISPVARPSARATAAATAALRGEAGPALLDSYGAERRPAGWFAADQSTRRGRTFLTRGAPDPTLAHPLVLAAGGFQYPSGAFVPDGSVEPTDRFAPTGRVGTRVPHRWLDAARTRSTLDLAGPDWAVLDAPQGDHPIGSGADFLAAAECLLLRPDHVVAWRGRAMDQAAQVRARLLAGV